MNELREKQEYSKNLLIKSVAENVLGKEKIKKMSVKTMIQNVNSVLGKRRKKIWKEK
jgi:hypothetical protein